MDKTNWENPRKIIFKVGSSLKAKIRKWQAKILLTLMNIHIKMQYFGETTFKITHQFGENCKNIFCFLNI